MANRISAIAGLQSIVRGLSQPQLKSINSSLEKVILIYLQSVSLEAIRAAPNSERSAVADVLEISLSEKDLISILKKWEPNWKIPSGISHAELSDTIRDLMYRVRDPFVPPEMPLTDAKSLDDVRRDRLIADIQTRCDEKQLKKLLGKWDKHFVVPKELSASEIRDHLLELFQGEKSPLTPLAKAKGRKK